MEAVKKPVSSYGEMLGKHLQAEELNLMPLTYILGHSILCQEINYSIVKIGLAEGPRAIDMDIK